MKKETAKKMMLAEINSTSIMDRKKMSDLEEDALYTINGLKKVVTKYGDGIIATLTPCEGDDLTQFQVFLPKRYNKTITDEMVEAINDEPHYKIKYLGGQYHHIEFL